MTIFYALVSKRSNIVLSEYTEYSGNFQQYTLQLMQRIELNTKKTFELEEFFFHYINEDDITVLCMTDKQMNKKVPFAFMVDVKKTLLATYTPKEIENAKAYSMPTFTEKIREKMVSQNYSFIPCVLILMLSHYSNSIITIQMQLVPKLMNSSEN